MTRVLTTTALAVVALVSCFAADAAAQNRIGGDPSTWGTMRPIGGDPSTWGPAPSIGGDPGTWGTPPAFGYYSNLVRGYGYQVTSVNHYTAAAQFGLERGDLISGVTINGRYHSLAYGGWHGKVNLALSQGGHMLLHVTDVRTGRTVSRWTNARSW